MKRWKSSLAMCVVGVFVVLVYEVRHPFSDWRYWTLGIIVSIFGLICEHEGRLLERSPEHDDEIWLKGYEAGLRVPNDTKGNA